MATGWGAIAISRNRRRFRHRSPGAWSLATSTPNHSACTLPAGTLTTLVNGLPWQSMPPRLKQVRAAAGMAAPLAARKSGKAHGKRWRRVVWARTGRSGRHSIRCAGRRRKRSWPGPDSGSSAAADPAACGSVGSGPPEIAATAADGWRASPASRRAMRSPPSDRSGPAPMRAWNSITVAAGSCRQATWPTGRHR